MIGSFFTRGLVLIFGYAYPAYECYKSVEMNKPDIEQLRFWCQYWVLVALLTVCERIGDVFIGWVPMYGEAKLAFFIYLWFPKTKGTRYVYESFFRPYIAKHETDIDRNLLELRTRAGDMAFLYWQKGASYIQTRTFDIFQFIAAQSTPKQPAQDMAFLYWQKGASYIQTRTFDIFQFIAAQSTPKQPAQAPPQSTVVQKPTTPNRKAVTTPLAKDGETSSPASSISSSENEDDEAEEASPAPATSPPILNEQKTTPGQALVESSKKLNSSEEQVMEMQIDSVPPVNETKPPSVQEIVMKESGRGPNLEKGGRLTRARSRTKPAGMKWSNTLVK